MKKKSRDENQMAFDVLSHTIKAAENDPKALLSAAASALSKLGASKGGKARAAILSAKRRKEIARKAAQSRWGDKK